MSLQDYIKSLGLKITFYKNSLDSLDRLSQLTQKTNQFNLTTKRYTVNELKVKLGNKNDIIHISVQDRFGDYGIVGLCIIDYLDNQANIDSFLMSCRVIGRKIEKWG